MTPADPTQSEAEAIVAGLTKAQERAIRTLTVPDGGGKWPARHALVGKGLLSPFPRHEFTPLAHLVRAHLQRSAALSELAALDAETMDKEIRND